MTATMILSISFVVALVLGVPVFVALGVSSLLALLTSGVSPQMIVQTMYGGVNNFPLIAIPCFVLAGAFMEKGGMTEQIVNVANRIFGRLSGGLGIVTILACMFFSAISGSGPGTVAAIGAIMIPAMIRRGYGEPFAAATASSGGALGVLIPPSNPMIIYGIIGNVSIASLFMAGVVPGMLVGSAMALTAFVIARRRGYTSENVTGSWRDLLMAIWRAKFALATPVLILGGIYSGVFTPVEASVVAVVYALIVGLFIERTLSRKLIFEALRTTHLVTGTIILIVGTSTVFGRLLTMYQVPTRVAETIVGWSDNWFVVLMLINFALLIIGMFMETLSTIIILTPILLPIVTKLGVDPIHFGVLFVVTNEIAFLTPPLGVNLFVASQLSNLPIEKVARAVLPFIGALIVALTLLTLFPQISLWLLTFMNS